MPVAAGRQAARGSKPAKGAAKPAKAAPKPAKGATRSVKAGRAPVGRSPRGARRTAGAGVRPPAAIRPIVPVTLGVAWAVLLLAVVDLSATLTALAISPFGMVAAASAVKASGAPAPAKRGTRNAGGNKVAWPLSAVALVAAPVTTFAALAGAVVAIAALVVVAMFGVLAVAGFAPRRRSGVSAVQAVVAMVAPGVACMCVVLARGQGANEGVALVGAICAYDAGSFLMGNSRTALGGPAGVIFGWLSVAVVAVAVAASLDPPFSGFRPWVLFGAVALLAPAGVALADRLVRGVRLPAMRRLDSLILAGPAWVVAVAVLLHR